MNWITLAPIIAKYGIDFAIKLFQKWSSGKDPTEADLLELQLLAAKDADAYYKEALLNDGK